MDKKTVDIILPAFNPPTGWADVIEKTFKSVELAAPDYSFNLILVNDGSAKRMDDASILQLENQLNDRFIFVTYPNNKGKGFALREGFKHSTSMYTIYTDVDFPYTTSSMVRLLQILSKNDVDVVAGTRDPSYYDQTPSDRKIISKVLKWLNRNLLGLTISDTQAGLKGCNEKGRGVFMQTSINRYLFDLEFLFLCSRNKDVNVTDVQVSLKEGVIFSKFNHKILLSEGMNFLKVLIKARFGG